LEILGFARVDARRTGQNHGQKPQNTCNVRTILNQHEQKLEEKTHQADLKKMPSDIPSNSISNPPKLAQLNQTLAPLCFV